jgi:hypothetical protein
MSDKFVFHGQTTFIDKPKDTVISNFQNTYIAGNDSLNDKVNSEVGKLVDLVLETKSLPDEEKEEIIQALHSVAEQVKDDKANKLTVKGTLTAIKDIVSNVAEIAVPATAIISTIFKLLGLGA